MALRTGLRREELSTFPWRYLRPPSELRGSGRNVKITLDPSDGLGMRTKGNKPRDYEAYWKNIVSVHEGGEDRPFGTLG